MKLFKRIISCWTSPKVLDDCDIQAAALAATTTCAAGQKSTNAARPSNIEEEMIAAVAEKVQIAVEEPSAKIETEENSNLAQINILREELAAAVAAKEAAEGHSAQLQRALLDRKKQAAAYESQASVLMQQRDRLAELLRCSEVAKMRLRQALKSKEDQRKGLAQSAQVAVLVLHCISGHLISTRPTSQPHRLPAGAVVRFVEGIEEEGTFGTVFEAVVNLRCAAKKANGPAGKEQLENEAAVLATIPPHTNIVHVYGMATAPEDDEDVLVMELAEEDMFSYRSEALGLTRNEVLSTCIQVVDGVQHVHDCGYVHSDIKPENCLKGSDGQVKLCDFGGARPIAIGTWGGTDGYLTPESCLRLEPVGRHDDIRGVCATLYEFWAGHKVAKKLSAAFAALPPATKKLVRQWCRSKGVGSTHEVWVAAAEHLGHIGIHEVEDRRGDLPKELLDMVLLGIREPKKLSLHTLKERLMAAIDTHPSITDGREAAGECTGSIEGAPCLAGGDPCTPEASHSRAEGEACMGDEAEASTVGVPAPAAAADDAPETAHGGTWFADLARRSEGAHEAAAGVLWSRRAETDLGAAEEVGCSAGQSASLEGFLAANEVRLGELTAAAAEADAAGSARWDAGTGTAFEAAPGGLCDAEWGAGEQGISAAAAHVAAGPAWDLGRQASSSATQHGSEVALQALQTAAAWESPAQADLWPAPSMRAGAVWEPSAASELGRDPRAVASIWTSGGQPLPEATLKPPVDSVWQPCAVDALRSAHLPAGSGHYNMWGNSEFPTSAGARF